MEGVQTAKQAAWSGPHLSCLASLVGVEWLRASQEWWLSARHGSEWWSGSYYLKATSRRREVPWYSAAYCLQRLQNPPAAAAAAAGDDDDGDDDDHLAGGDEAPAAAAPAVPAAAGAAVQLEDDEDTDLSDDEGDLDNMLLDLDVPLDADGGLDINAAIAQILAGEDQAAVEADGEDLAAAAPQAAGGAGARRSTRLAKQANRIKRYSKY